MAPSKKQARKNIKRVITDVAPTLAHALGGPLAGAAVAKISNALFGSPSEDEAAVDVALQNANTRTLDSITKRPNMISLLRCAP